MTDKPKFRCDRMEKLADYLDTVPPEKFDMSGWGPEGEPVSCGFSGCAIGCAIGWAIHGRLFRDLDWSHKPYVSGGGVWHGCPSNKKTGSGQYQAIAEIFGISASEAECDLFGPELTGTPKEVAKRIRKFSDAKCRELSRATD